MSATAILLIAFLAVLIVIALFIGASAARTRRLKQRFGPEYDRAVDGRESQRKAEAELAARERRVQNLDIRPLTAAERAEFSARWNAIQERFVDRPDQAVGEAQRLVTTVLTDRGYPTEGFDQILADLSVEHARNLENYRAAHEISQKAAEGTASTEDLRKALIRYRAMFDDLLGDPGDQQESAGSRPASAARRDKPASMPGSSGDVPQCPVANEPADEAVLPDQPGRAGRR